MSENSDAHERCDDMSGELAVGDPDDAEAGGEKGAGGADGAFRPRGAALARFLGGASPSPKMLNTLAAP